jgi:hypothetical protein
MNADDKAQVVEDLLSEQGSEAVKHGPLSTAVMSTTMFCSMHSGSTQVGGVLGKADRKAGR